jgi:hypothetical protein
MSNHKIALKPGDILTIAHVSADDEPQAVAVAVAPVETAPDSDLESLIGSAPAPVEGDKPKPKRAKSQSPLCEAVAIAMYKGREQVIWKAGKNDRGPWFRFRFLSKCGGFAEGKGWFAKRANIGAIVTEDKAELQRRCGCDSCNS